MYKNSKFFAVCAFLRLYFIFEKQFSSNDNENVG